MSKTRTQREDAASFLSDAGLSAAIKDVANGDQVRCAVAFWGKGSESLLNPGGLAEGARIICDVALGGTNPKALVALGAPNNARLSCIDGLHAKMYLSDRGLIVCSANASGGGVGFGRSAQLIEAGTRHPPGSEAYAEAARWFEKLWRRGRQVGDAELALAKARFVPRRNPSKAESPGDARSLLDAIAADPGRFRGVGLVLSEGTTTIPQRDAAADAIIAADSTLTVPVLSRTERTAIMKWPPHNVFSQWKRQDIDAWPRRFICAHRSGGGDIRYFFYERAHEAMVGGDEGAVLGARTGKMRRELGLKHGAEVMAEIDARRLRKLFRKGARLIETPEKLLADLES